jgi:hypothetical protein
MNIKDLKDFLETLPSKFDDFELVNGEYGKFDEEEGDEEDIYYRVDKPINSVYVDEDSEEICFLNQTQEDINEIGLDGVETTTE